MVNVVLVDKETGSHGKGTIAKESIHISIRSVIEMIIGECCNLLMDSGYSSYRDKLLTFIELTLSIENILQDFQLETIRKWVSDRYNRFTHSTEGKFCSQNGNYLSLIEMFCFLYRFIELCIEEQSSSSSSSPATEKTSKKILKRFISACCLHYGSHEFLANLRLIAEQRHCVWLLAGLVIQEKTSNDDDDDDRSNNAEEICEGLLRIGGLLERFYLICGENSLNH